MSSGTTATWFDALPPLSEYNLPPSNNASCTSWSSQIVSAREAVRAGRKGSHYALAQTLLDAYKSGMGSECLSESLVILRGLHECASSAERKQTTMIDLGEALFAEHKRTGTLEPVQEMVRIYEQASSEDTLGLDMRCQLAQALIARGAFTGEDADLCRAKAMLDAIHLESDEWDASNPRFVVVSAMHHAVMWKAHRQHSLPDLRRLGEDLVRHLKGPYPLSWRADLLAACFSVCTVICRLSDNVACTSDAVKMAEDTLKTLSQETFAVLSALTEFCLILEARHKGKAGYVLTLRQLVERMFQAAKGNRVNTGEAHHALGSWMLRSELWSAHDRANSADVAAAQYRQALAICPANHVHVHVYLVGLCLSLIYRNRWTGSRSALNEAVALYDSHADIARRVPPFAINLTGVMMRRAQTGRLRLVSKWTLTRRAVQVLQDALLATPSSNSYFPDLLEQLSLVYSLESSWGGSVDETEALAIMRRALTTRIEQGRIETSREEWVLAKFLVSLAQRKGDTGAVNEAMQLLDNISQPPTDENNNDVGLDWLRANCYMVRYKLLGAPEDLRIAQDMFLAACDETRGTLWRTLRHVFSWADTARYAGQEATEMRAYQRIISTLPRLAYLGEDIATRVEALQLAEGLSCRAATLALTLNNVCGAIEVLEQSRGVVWSQSLQPKTAVESIPPQYVEAFTGTARSLEKATNPAERRRLAAQLEALSRQIRRVVGYERFCLPRLYPDLKAGASLGFVVLVIPSDAFTDVVIIRDTEMAPVHLRLPSLKLPRLQKLGATLKKMSDRSRDSATDRPRGMKKVEAGQAQLSSDVEAAYMNALGQLWTELVYPVLTELRLQHSSNRPRLWWCSTGACAELPLHAAGIYKGVNQDCLSNYAVSSYTPTISALVDAQAKKADPNDCSSSQVLVVSLSEVSGLSPLPNARIETDLIRKRIPLIELRTLSDHQASVANVLETLPSTSVLHLACHGHQSQDDPLTSGFSLHDGRLTLEQLMRLQLPHAELAYLSACETASTDKYQPDEVINLAATMLFVGFKSVIATMWSMNDLDGPFIAERVYRSSFQEGKLNLDAVPYALDAAVRELRESGVHPSRWATYVHIGA